MSYADLYLDYLNETETYQDIYENLAFQTFVQEVSPAQLKGLIGKEQDYLNKLVQQKAKFADNPQMSAAIDTKIQAAGSSLGKLKTQLGKSPEAAGMPNQPAGGTSQADIPAAPVPPEVPTVTSQQLVQQKAAAAKDAAATGPQAGMGPGGSGAGVKVPKKQGTEKDLQAAQGTPKDQSIGSAEIPKVQTQDLTAAQQVKQGVGDAADKAKELAGGAVDKAKEVGKDVAGGVEKFDTAFKQGMGTTNPSALKGWEDTAVGVGKAAQKGVEKLGASPETATGVGGAVASLGASPLGLAALGGAAAYGGYKLYKRFMSKSATACKGYSGADKTSCMKSYMGAKRNQAQSRGAEAGGPA